MFSIRIIFQKAEIRSCYTILRLFCKRQTNYLKYVELQDVYQQVLRLPLCRLNTEIPLDLDRVYHIAGDDTSFVIPHCLI